MKEPNNKAVSLYAIACVTVIAITAMMLTTVANAQVGQPYDGGALKNRDINIGFPLRANRAAVGTWQKDVELQNANTNRGIVYVAVTAVFPPAAAVTAPVALIDFFVTKRKRVINASL
jgi:hypothetical protein